ncbi:uncharacterized protein EDB93DRAFT_1250778 [Suillus bovinus]|uniref:uncharacterized protein n=1 Tax=Suillus bovinus TaxID=48563 RepID=UPI001B867D58|nr:uncharacterized protein EDB93DRAFT_1250778 [Suillus bovinus]KAG2146496.1 hypothetical protein EDB93DRAFT_1250778 [Suillus bovinus]
MSGNYHPFANKNLSVAVPIAPKGPITSEPREAPPSPKTTTTPPALSVPSSPVPAAAGQVDEMNAEMDALIAKSEQLDLEVEAHRHRFSTEELFGSFILIGLLMSINVLLLFLLAAMDTMNIKSSQSTQA